MYNYLIVKDRFSGLFAILDSESGYLYNLISYYCDVVNITHQRGLSNMFSKKKKTIERLKKHWGRLPQQEYSDDQLKALKYYYTNHINKENDIDDITWNDLDMDNFYMLINNTCSSMGEEYLYSMLRKPYFDPETKEERERVMQYFDQNETVRYEIMYILSSIGKIKTISLYEYLNRLGGVETEQSTKHVLMNLCYPLSVLIMLGNLGTGLLCLFATIIYSVITYFSGKAKIDSYYSVITTLMRTLKASEKMEKLNIPELNEYQDTIRSASGRLKAFHKGGFVVTALNGSGSPLDLMLDYFRILTHADLILFYRMLRIYRNETQSLNQLYETFGFLDSMISCASFRRILPVWCNPELVNQEKPFLELDDIYHPMIDNAVANSIYTNASVLLTGSNASGKSTFIKTVAINAILSQTINTAICKRYRASFFRIASSMALTDNLLGNESYYIVEIKSLKRILDASNEAVPMLCFIDEVLRGTNTLERIAASASILSTMAQNNCICFAATHDLELTSILEDYYKNYHFQEKITEGDILFDYTLYEGKSNSRNAIKLLELLGYPKEIITNSQEACEAFSKLGIWKKV